MIKHLLVAALAAGLVLTVPPPAGANEEGGSSSNASSSSSASPGARGREFPTIASQTTGMQKIEGFLTLYRNEERDLLWMEIPRNRQNSDFLLSTSLTRGQSAGMTTGDTMVRFEIHDDQVLLVVPELFFTAEGGLRTVVESTYPDRVIGTTRIVAKTGNNVLIDAKAFLAAQTPNFAVNPRGSVVTQVTSAKSFPENTVVELKFRGPQGASGVYFNLSELKNTGYRPRVADSRVGYFLTARRNFSADETADTTFERFINRWHLEKADPSLSLSPPKEPIVIYIEHTVPTRYRRWVREGLEMWNEAFEEIGIVGAIQVRQQTTTNEFAHLDPEDVRYNFFRWITSQRAFAIAPSRVDPRTGQVLDSDILFDESMARFYVQDYDFWMNSLPETEALSPRMKLWLAENPHQHPLWNLLRPQYQMMIRTDPELAGYTPEELFAEDILGDGRHALAPSNLCNIGNEMRGQMEFVHLAAQMHEFQQFARWAAQSSEAEGDADANGSASDADDEEKKKDEEEEEEEEKNDRPRPRNLLDEWPEEFVGPIIREITAHELGHSLGLRHNFKASTWKTLDEILNPEDPNAATTASVMDYNAFVMNPDGSPPPNWVTPRIGPYDKWAIEYGYAIPGTQGYPRNEAQMLKQILAKAGQPGLAYGTDEDAWSPDPLIVRWDMSKDPLEFHQVRLQVAEQIEENLLDIVAREGEAFDRLRSAFQSVQGVRFSAASAAARFIGGYDLNRVYKGDGEGLSPISKVPAERQREAMAMIIDTILREESFQADPEVLRNLAIARWSHRDSPSRMAPHLFPFQERVLLFQGRVLFALTNPERIQYIHDASFYADAGEDVYTLPEMMADLTNAIWSEVIEGKTGTFTAQDPMINHLRRNLQREYASRLITIATDAEGSIFPTVARTLAWKTLRDLKADIDSKLESSNGAMDPFTEAHLVETTTRIAAALNAQMSIGGAFGPSQTILRIGRDTPAAPMPGETMNPFNHPSAPHHLR